MRPLTYVEIPFVPCKPAKLLLADENKSLFLFRLVIVIIGLDMKISILYLQSTYFQHKLLEIGILRLDRAP